MGKSIRKPATGARRATQRRTQAERTAATQALLVEAAIRSIHDLGYGATTVAEIARRAGVSLGALQHHFKTRNEIVLAAFRHTISLYFQPYDQVEKAGLSPPARASTLVALLTKYFVSREAVAMGSVWLATRGEPDLHREIRTFYRQVSRELGVRWRRLFADCVCDRKAFNAATTVFLHSLRGFQTHYLMNPDQADVDQFLRGAETLLLGALSRPAPGTRTRR